MSSSKSAAAALTPLSAAPAPRELPRRALVERKDGRVPRQFTLYLPEPVARRFARYCAGERLELSVAGAAAIEEYLARRDEE